MGGRGTGGPRSGSSTVSREVSGVGSAPGRIAALSAAAARLAARVFVPTAVSSEQRGGLAGGDAGMGSL